jgi:hypothetical protein
LTAGGSGYWEDSAIEKLIDPRPGAATITNDGLNGSGRDWVRPMLRKFIAACLILLAPCALFAQETGTAVIYGTGSVFLNGAALANSSAVTVGDVVQTRDNGVSNINAPGATVVVESNTIVRFQSGGFALDRGSVSVATGKGMSVFARDFKITPVSNDWTEFYVTRASGSIQIIARKNSVTVNCGTNSATTVREGQQISREDASDCGLVAKRGGGAAPAARAPVLDSRWVEAGGIGAGGALLGWVLFHSDNPVSPSGP